MSDVSRRRKVTGNAINRIWVLSSKDGWMFQ